MRNAMTNVAGWIGFGAFLVAVIGVSILFQSISDAGRDVNGITGFLAEWFFG